MPTISLCVTKEQGEIISHGATMKVVTCGRRYGKTTMGKAYLIKVALEKPNAESSYVGKTYKLAYKMYCSISSNKPLAAYIKNAKMQPSPHIMWRNGHTTWFFSGDRPDNLRGDGLSLCIVDEAAHVPERLINEVLQPAMLDCGGTIVLLSTFRGRNFYYDYHTTGQTYPNDEDCISWIKPTSSAIWAQGVQGKLRLKRMEKRLPKSIWKQECECEVDENQAAVFDLQKLTACVGGSQSPPTIGRGYVIGYDSGKKANPPAIVILECEVSSNKSAVVHAEEMPLGSDYTSQVDRIVSLARAYKACVVIDSTGAGTKDAIVDFLRRAAPEIPIYPIFLRQNLQHNLVTAAAKTIEDMAISIPGDCATLIYQLRQFEYEARGHGYYYRAPIGEFDDLVWALLMALDGQKRRLYRPIQSIAPRPVPGSQGDIFYRQRHGQDTGGGTL